MSDHPYLMLNLEAYYNADGISDNINPGVGAFGIHSTYPAEELPPSGKPFSVSGIPFLFPVKEYPHKNNIECYNQIVSIPPNIYESLWFLGSSDNANYLEKFTISYRGKTSICNVGLSNWIEEKPIYNEKLAVVCSHLHNKKGDDRTMTCKLWLQQLNLAEDELPEVHLPDNPCFHIFAITLKVRGVSPLCN